MLAKAVVNFFIIWKIKLGLKGAGFIIRILAPVIKKLQKYPIKLDEGQVIFSDMRDSGIGWLFYKHLGIVGEENGLLKAINYLSTGDSVIWDIGSNCGILSYAITKSAKFKSLHFFEPNPIVYEVAKDALAPFSNVSGYNFGISNIETTMSLTIPDDGRSTKCATLESEKVQRSGVSISVQCKVGDQLIADGTVAPPNIIKIDVEGHEMSVLEGLEQYIRDNKPLLLFEHLSLTDEEIRQMTPDSYQIQTIDDISGVLSETFDRSVGHNSALIPKK